MSVIEFKKVMKQYEHGESPAVRDVSFAVEKGEFICIIGPSGCGKTTLLKMIAGLEAQTGGEVEKPQSVSMAFQQGALFPWLSVYENAALGLSVKDVPQPQIQQRVMNQLYAMQMEDFAQRHPAELSGGQRQRVGIARALAVDPEVLLLDEPFSALDPKTTAELHDDIIKVWREHKMTVVMVSHLIEEAVSLAGRIILMRDGTIDHTFSVDLPYPRRESDNFHREVMKVRREFFK
jgi:NitT/TauT family transport system ATP-binding protein